MCTAYTHILHFSHGLVLNHERKLEICQKKKKKATDCQPLQQWHKS